MFLIFLLMSNSVSSHLTCRQTEQLWFESGAILKSTSALKYFTVGLSVCIWAPGPSAVHTLSHWCPKVFRSDIHHLWLCILPRFFLFFLLLLFSHVTLTFGSSEPATDHRPACPSVTAHTASHTDTRSLRAAASHTRHTQTSQRTTLEPLDRPVQSNYITRSLQVRMWEKKDEHVLVFNHKDLFYSDLRHPIPAFLKKNYSTKTMIFYTYKRQTWRNWTALHPSIDSLRWSPLLKPAGWG